MPNSVIEAIQQGIWDYEPKDTEANDFDSTDALPGSNEKLSILASRLSSGKPLWHPEDRLTYGDRQSRRIEQLSSDGHLLGHCSGRPDCPFFRWPNLK